MNDKELSYIFFKHSKIVINRYEELTKEESCDESIKIRKDFEVVFENVKREVQTKLRNCGSPDHYRYHFPDYLFYLGQAGYNKYGVFAWKELYEEANWTIDIIDTYKDSIAWLLLLEYGNFKFTEEILRKYDCYIPWFNSTQGEEKYIPFPANHWGKSLGNFKNIGKLSRDFILSHLSVFDIEALCKTGEFEIDTYLFQILYDLMKEKDRTGNYVHNFFYNIGNNPRVLISCETIYYIAKKINIEDLDSDWDCLLKKNELTEDDFFRICAIRQEALKALFELDFDVRRKYVSLIESNKELVEILGMDFVKQLYQGGGPMQLYKTAGLHYWGKAYCASDVVLNKLPYTYDFSVDLIKSNIDLWNQELYEYYCGMQRTPDTNYSYHYRVTIWDILFKQETILLTYDLCKYLVNLNVRVGGYYVMEDVHYLGTDVPNYDINALSLFQFKDILNKSELDKILADIDLIDSLLSNTVSVYSSLGTSYSICRENMFGNHGYAPKGTGIVDYIVLDFFKDFSFDKFKEVVMK